MKNPESPMCDYQEMLQVGWSPEAVPYVIWPKELIDTVIAGIKERKNIDIIVHLRNGKMKVESISEDESLWDMAIRKYGKEKTMEIIRRFSDSSIAIEK